MKYVVWVEIECAPGCHAALLEHVRENAGASLERESGCEQFDVLVPLHGADAIALYEVYESAEAFRLHTETSHYVQFARRTAELIAVKTVTSFNRA